jgi:hypothetical protein
MAVMYMEQDRGVIGAQDAILAWAGTFCTWRRHKEGYSRDFGGLSQKSITKGVREEEGHGVLQSHREE